MFVKSGIGFSNTGSHAVIEIGNALPAMLIILIGLNGDTGQGRIAVNIVRLSQMAMPGAEAILEELDDINLTAGCGQGEEIQVMNMDITLFMGSGMLGL